MECSRNLLGCKRFPGEHMLHVAGKNVLVGLLLNTPQFKTINFHIVITRNLDNYLAVFDNLGQFIPTLSAGNARRHNIDNRRLLIFTQCNKYVRTAGLL